MRERLGDLRAELAGLTPTGLSGADAAAVVRFGVDLERLGVAIKTRFAKRVADTGAFATTGHRDAASWLAGVSGESTGAAKSVLDTAEKLTQAPKVEEAFSDGKLSLAQAKVVAGAGSLDPSSQDQLLASAKQDSFQELKEGAARIKRAALGEAAEEAKERRAHEGRFLRITPTAHGGVRLSGRLTRLDGARVVSVLDAERQVVFKEARKAGRRTTHEAYLADAFVRVIGGERSRRPQAKVVVHADLTALNRGSVEGDERCEIEGVGSIPVAVARDLFGDCWAEFIVKDGDDVRTITSHKRTIRQPLRDAVLARDGRRCVVPGCPNTKYLQFDHIWEFARGGRTELKNLQLLCTPHHKQKTLYGFRMVGGKWVGPD